MSTISQRRRAAQEAPAVKIEWVPRPQNRPLKALADVLYSLVSGGKDEKGTGK